MSLNTSSAQSPEGRAIVACAGSGKTTLIVRDAIARRDASIAVLTYTNNNAAAIRRKFGEQNGGVPPNVDVLTWFGFLLRHGARPYQRIMRAPTRIEGITFVNHRSARGAIASDTRRYYFGGRGLIYSDKIAQFVLECDKRSRGRVLNRLKQVYTDIYIDEFQDMAGWDLDLIEWLLDSPLRVTLVGDPRQHVYTTNPSGKNRHFLGPNVMWKLELWRKHGLCTIENLAGSYRCHTEICEFVNLLWPEMEPMTANCDHTTKHDGVFLVSEQHAPMYLDEFSPQELRYHKRAKTVGRAAMNFGMAKGMQFPRILVVPTQCAIKFLESGDVRHIQKSKQRLHVAVTRAQHSVAFVCNSNSNIIGRRWTPDGVRNELLW